MSDILVKISEAVQHVARLTREGAGLQDALVKVALDRDLTQEQVRRVVETVNVHNTLAHFKQGQKRAEFPVSDSRDVISAAFKEKAAAYDPAFPTPDEYKLDDVNQFATFDDRLMMRKAAQIIEQTPAPARYLRDPNDLVQLAQREIGRMVKEAETAHIAAEGCRVKIYTAIQHLAESFQRQGATSLGLFQKEARAMYGELGQDYFPTLVTLVPKKFQGSGLEKLASVINTGTYSHQLFQHLCALEGEFVAQTRRLQEKQAEAAHWKGELGSVFTKAAAIRGGNRSLGTNQFPMGRAFPGTAVAVLSPPTPPTPTTPTTSSRGGRGRPSRSPVPLPTIGGGGSSTSGGGTPSPPDEGEVEKGKGGRGWRGVSRATEGAGNAASGLSSTIEGIGARGAGLAGMGLGWIANMQPLISDPVPYGYYEQLGDTLRMQESIQQVLMKDPILKGRSPEELFPLLQTIIKVAPNLAMHPPVLASILREATTGQYAAIDPMMLTQLAQAQQALFKTQLLRQQQLANSDIRMQL